MFAAYVNPRTARVAMVRQENGLLAVHNRAIYTTADFDSFESILQRYLRGNEGNGEFLCIAATGPVTGSEVSSKYLPWHVDAHSLREKFSFRGVRLVNEHIATARGIFEQRPDRVFTINGSAKVCPGNVGLMAVDDSLEEVLMVSDGEQYTTFSTNGGHASFAPSSQLESELWQYLYPQREVIEVGDIVSRDGLVRLVEFLAETRGLDIPDWLTSADDRPAKIVEVALSGKDPVAVEAVDLFVGCFAREAANLALRGVTTGGLYLAGKMVTELMPSLDQGRFLRNFVRRGPAEEKLSAIPINVLMDRNTALLGAARLAVEFSGSV